MMKKMFLVSVCLLLLATTLSGCFDDGGDVGDADAIYTDQAGHTITIEATPTKVITLAPSLTETMFALGLGAKVIGCDDASNNIPGAKNVTPVMTWTSLDLEKVVSLKPDIIFMDKTLDASGNTYAALSGAGLIVFQFFPKDLDDMLEQTKLIGHICDRVEATNAYVDGLRSRIDAVTAEASNISDADKPDVLFVTYYDGASDPWVGTDNTMSGDLVAGAGGKNVISDTTGIYVQVGMESIVSANPDIIFTSQSDIWPTMSRQAILNDTVFKDVSAVKSGRVYDINGDHVDRTGPGLVDGLEEMQEKINAYEAAK